MRGMEAVQGVRMVVTAPRRDPSIKLCPHWEHPEGSDQGESATVQGRPLMSLPQGSFEEDHTLQRSTETSANSRRAVP